MWKYYPNNAADNVAESHVTEAIRHVRRQWGTCWGVGATGSDWLGFQDRSTAGTHERDASLHAYARHSPVTSPTVHTM